MRGDATSNWSRAARNLSLRWRHAIVIFVSIRPAVLCSCAGWCESRRRRGGNRTLIAHQLPLWFEVLHTAVAMSTGEELSVVGMEENGREQEREQEQEQEHSSKSDVAAAIQACDPPSKSLTQEQEQEQQRQQLQQYKVDVVEPLRTLVSRPHGEELSEDSIGEIRELLARRLPACVQDDCIGPLRAKLWSIMLLGLRPQDLNRCVACDMMCCVVLNRMERHQL